MTAPCPVLGFVVVMEPAAGRPASDRDALRRAWSELLDTRGLVARGSIEAERPIVEVRSESSQATENDRDAVQAWLSSRGELRDWSVGDLEDLSARGAA
jgi:uncharacterized protein YggL (DUF469 family)